MKQILLPLVFMLMPVVASAQQSAHPQVSAPVKQSLRFGYFSYEEVLHTMPGYAIAKHNMDDLRAKYDAETKRAEDEFNAKYEEFLHQRYVAEALTKAKQQAADPSTQWADHESVWETLHEQYDV